jgi:putative spermidine/putrescine transport system substrate-binding protein
MHESAARIASVRLPAARRSPCGRDHVDLEESTAADVDYVPSMTAHSTRARRHGLGALGVTATLLVALASTATATTPPDSTTPADGSAAPADTAGGDAAADLEALYAAAQEEGQVNLIALPDNWANYGGILQSFRDKYPGIDNPVQTPDATSADELTAVETQRGSDTMPDSIDVGPPFALQAVEEGIWDPYMPTVWDEIPDALKDPDGNWVAAYYGIMSLGTNTTLVADPPTSFADLNDEQYAGQVALNGDPREAGAAFAGVWAAALANGGSFDDIMPGIEYFADLKEQGILTLVAADDNTILSGETPIVLDWTYNWPGRLDAITEAGFEWTSVVPSDGVYGSYYAQGVVAESPHPNAGRLWIEHILSDEGALGYLEGGAIPARYATLVENGLITEDMLANLPPAELIEQIAFPTADQIAAAQALLAENWGPMVADT